MKMIGQFKREVQRYYRSHKRDFLWRRTRDPYRILVSEIMLQQTQTGRVETKYPLFLERFPSFRALARATPRDVLTVWQGLGYNRRALALKRASEIVVAKYGGKLPRDPEALQTLPGVGNATAGAVAAFAFNRPESFIETNIRRVFIHYFFKGRKKVSDEKILRLIGGTMDHKNPREWYYALMDHGAMLGKLPENPNKRSARYRIQSRFKGSRRELRGKILKLLVAEKSVSVNAIAKHFSQPLKYVEDVLNELAKEGFVHRKGKKVRMSP